eukprot:scaffold92837_cov20-Tisochrysis_lutea.AAC.1
MQHSSTVPGSQPRGPYTFFHSIGLRAKSMSDWGHVQEEDRSGMTVPDLNTLRARLRLKS